jgi:hypothetical protein
VREGRSAVFSASIAPHYKARLALKVCAVLSAAAKWIHSVISVTPTGLTHFIGGAPAWTLAAWQPVEGQQVRGSSPSFLVTVHRPFW